MWIIKNRKIFYTISGLMIAFSIFAISFWQVKLGIDFTGGSILEFEFSDERPSNEVVIDSIAKIQSENEIEFGDFSLRQTGEKGFILRTKEIDVDSKNLILSEMSTLSMAEKNIEDTDTISSVSEIRFNTIGPTIGNELKTKSLLSIGLVILLIIMFIAFAFRQVSKPVSSWKYGLVAIAALMYDVLVSIGLFAVLGHFFGIEVDGLFVVAILVVLGYSINDTIVIFDRIRENLILYPEKKRNEHFESVVSKSLNQTMSRSINTSITTLIPLGAILVLGGESTRFFSLALIAGIAAGTYSSIFFAAPMLVTIQKIQEKLAKNSA